MGEETGWVLNEAMSTNEAPEWRNDYRNVLTRKRDRGLIFQDLPTHYSICRPILKSLIL